MAEVALCLSGGGFRAAVFHLGVLSYLNHVRFDDGSTLLDHVHIITSISGGALTGMFYITGEAKGYNRTEVFKDLYKRIITSKIGVDLLNRFDAASEKGVGLIEVLADIYNDVFFKDEEFGTIMNFVDWSGFHHFAADATDFGIGKPFRFQATPKINDPMREEPFGVIGNWQHKIRREHALHIRLADIMAATSCFPMVFEPITYPDDFKFNEKDKPNDTDISFTLMDGGLVDNQGIDPALRAEEHMLTEGLNIDTIILSDAGSMKEPEDEDSHSKLSVSLKSLFWDILIVGVICTEFAIGSYLCSSRTLFGASIIIVLLSVAFCILIVWVNSFLLKQIESKVNFKVRNSFIWKSPFGNIWTFVKSRVGSAYRMVDIIMMGHIRQKALKDLYDDFQWDCKVLMNTLPLFAETKWQKIWKKAGMDGRLVPSSKVIRNTRKSAKMETTLWFSDKEIKDGMPRSILACGQYTICWNLLVYIKRIKKRMANGEDINLSDGQKRIMSLESVLMGDWERFNKEPLLLTLKYIQ